MRTELLELSRRLRRRVRDDRAAAWKLSPAAESGAASDPALRLRRLAERIEACRLCGLGAARIKSVPGVGCPRARVMFIGEGPGFSEDRRGEPFVGRAGELLDRILAAIGLSRETVFIANVVKCHPMKDPAARDARANDRPPAPEETAACRPYLDEQIAIVRPAVLVTLGLSAARCLLASEEPMGRLRGRWSKVVVAGSELDLLPTYHPAALLRNPALKKDVWADMKALKSRLEA
ncbi:MAG: uracil-DNA glycosylase [Elusimicrobia bacterium]|nr:uracil-DNA glycosylase [Elusimicrobiota bacterium]